MNGETETMYYIHQDYLGSYDVITDEKGSVLERLSFNPWGDGETRPTGRTIRFLPPITSTANTPARSTWTTSG